MLVRDHIRIYMKNIKSVFRIFMGFTNVFMGRLYFCCEEL